MEQFIDKMRKDPALKEKFYAILERYEKSRDTKAVSEELSELALTEGFFTKLDGEITKKLRELGEQDVGMDGFIALAASYGYTVTNEELRDLGEKGGGVE